MKALKNHLNHDDNLTSQDNVICLPDVSAKIAESAYYKAESRGFEPGHEVEDWLEAEQQYLL
jgi:hypothetical protein